MPMLPSSQTASPTPSPSRNTSNSASSSPTFLSTIRATLTPAPPSSLLSDLAPHILQTRILSSPHFSYRNPLATSLGSSSQSIRGRLGWPTGRVDLNGLYIIEKVDELLELECPPADYDGQGSTAEQFPLIIGFQATTPTALSARLERRKKRSSVVGAVPTIKEGVVVGEEGLGINKRAVGGAVRRPRKSIKADEVDMTREELERDASAVGVDMRNVSVRRVLLNGEIAEVNTKISELENVRDGLLRGLLGLREEELELEDELQGIQERSALQEDRKQGRTVSASLRRRKGPAFLPSEHDDLPSGVAFMTLEGHLAPITSLDFSEPYGIAVTSSLDESVRLWDLTNGDQMGFLRGHKGAVKALQVESNICVTGGVDGHIRVWDLDLAELASSSAADSNERESTMLGTPSKGMVNSPSDGLMRDTVEESIGGPCLKTLDGHRKAVTSLFFDDNCLVTGSSDRTLRQWDLATGQCVLTMDILWAISNPLASQTLSSEPTDIYANDPFTSPASSPRRGLRRQSSGPVTSYSDASWDLYEDYVGSLQFWGYALASGTADGCVRMWDMRTGQASRTLVGHTGPVTCVQFDETHLVSGSLDKTIRIWDLRTGSISETIRYSHAITALQFDSRKIVAAAGENGVRVYNRTTLQHSSLEINGHTEPVERLRYVDRYLASSGGGTVKLWAM